MADMPAWVPPQKRWYLAGLLKGWKCTMGSDLRDAAGEALDLCNVAIYSCIEEAQGPCSRRVTFSNMRSAPLQTKEADFLFSIIAILATFATFTHFGACAGPTGRELAGGMHRSLSAATWFHAGRQSWGTPPDLSFVLCRPRQYAQRRLYLSR